MARKLSYDLQERKFDFLAYKNIDRDDLDGEVDRMIASMDKILESHVLTDRQKECVNRRYVDGDRVIDIAADLGVSAGTISKHLKKARNIVMGLMSLSFPRLKLSATDTKHVTRHIRRRGVMELGEFTILGLTTGAQK